jgi:hypothetical protein
LFSQQQEGRNSPGLLHAAGSGPSTHVDCCGQHVQVRFSFDEPEFAMIDTLFSLAEAHLFMQLVELKEERPDLLPPGKNFATMYR